MQNHGCIPEHEHGPLLQAPQQIPSLAPPKDCCSFYPARKATAVTISLFSIKMRFCRRRRQHTATLQHKGPSIYTSNKLHKSNVKRCVFRARREAARESVSLIFTARLFQMSGPQTEKARRQNCVVVGRTMADLADLLMAVDDDARLTPLTLNVTKSSRYAGGRW